MLELLIAVVVLGVFAYVVFWALGQIGLPEPFNKIALVIFVLVILIVLWRMFGKYVPGLN